MQRFLRGTTVRLEPIGLEDPRRILTDRIIFYEWQKVGYNLNLINKVLKKTFDKNKNIVFLYDLHMDRRTNKVFSPSKSSLFRQIKLLKSRYRYTEFELHRSSDTMEIFLPNIINAKKKTSKSLNDIFESSIYLSKKHIDYKTIKTGFPSYGTSA